MNELFDRARAGDRAAIEAIVERARADGDRALLRRCARWLIDAGQPALLVQGDGEPRTPAELLAELDDSPIALISPLELELPWDATALRLVCCDWAEHLLPMFELEYPDTKAPDTLQIARRYAFDLADEAALEEAWDIAWQLWEDSHEHWWPAGEASDALVGATRPEGPGLQGMYMARVDPAQNAWEPAEDAGQRWQLARLLDWLLTPSAAMQRASSLEREIAEARRRGDEVALRRCAFWLTRLGLTCAFTLDGERRPLRDFDYMRRDWLDAPPATERRMVEPVDAEVPFGEEAAHRYALLLARLVAVPALDTLCEEADVAQVLDRALASGDPAAARPAIAAAVEAARALADRLSPSGSPRAVALEDVVRVLEHAVDESGLRAAEKVADAHDALACLLEDVATEADLHPTGVADRCVILDAAYQAQIDLLLEVILDGDAEAVAEAWRGRWARRLERVAPHL